MDIPIRVPERQPIDGQDNVIHDVMAALYAYGDKPPELRAAAISVRQEQLLANAAALDDKLVDLAVAAVASLKKLRAACPELTVRRDP